MNQLSLLAFGAGGWGDEILRGLAVTLALALATFPVAIALSFAVHWARTASLAPVRLFGQAYATLFKSLPEILTLLILYYQAQAVLNWLAQRLSPGSDFSISPFIAGLVALSLVISAYGSEVVRAAMNAVGRGQFEAAAALGLSPMRAFQKVILPQLWRHALPGFGNLWVILLKDTSLVSVIALSDLTHVAVMAINTTREPFLFYLAIGMLYVALVTLSSRAQKALELRASRGFPPPEARMLDLWLDNLPLWRDGLLTTIGLTVSAVVIGFFLAVPIGVARSRSRGVLGLLALGYVNVLRGLPLLVLLFLIYYGVGQFNRELRQIGLWWFFRDATYCGLLALVLNTAAYQAEIIRGSLDTISKSVLETNAALNLTRWTAFRRVLLPIALSKALPALGNEVILLLKSTSLVAIITVFDLMGQARFIFSKTFDLGVYYVAAAHYLVVVLLIEWAVRRIEARTPWVAR